IGWKWKHSDMWSGPVLIGRGLNHKKESIARRNHLPSETGLTCLKGKWCCFVLISCLVLREQGSRV
ncbi:hypothetical protein, partial [Alkalibacterium sp. s-m-28]